MQNARSQPVPFAAEKLIVDLEKRIFDFFWETTNPVNGLVRDRWPSDTFASITAVGFGLTAYPIGVAVGIQVAVMSEVVGAI